MLSFGLLSQRFIHLRLLRRSHTNASAYEFVRIGIWVYVVASPPTTRLLVCLQTCLVIVFFAAVSCCSSYALFCRRRRRRRLLILILILFLRLVFLFRLSIFIFLLWLACIEREKHLNKRGSDVQRVSHFSEPIYVFIFVAVAFSLYVYIRCCVQNVQQLIRNSRGTFIYFYLPPIDLFIQKHKYVFLLLLLIFFVLTD